MARVTRVLDALLTKVAPHGDAGACQSNQGEPCITGYQYKCVEHLKYRRTINGTYPCTGACHANGTYGPWISYTHC